METIENYDFGRILRDTKELTMGENGSNLGQRNVVYPESIPHYMHQVSKGDQRSINPLTLQPDELFIFVQFKDSIPKSELSSIVQELEYMMRNSILTFMSPGEKVVSREYLGVYDPNSTNKENMLIFPGPFFEGRGDEVDFTSREDFDTLAIKTDYIDLGSNFLEKLHGRLTEND